MLVLNEVIPKMVPIGEKFRIYRRHNKQISSQQSNGIYYYLHRHLCSRDIGFLKFFSDLLKR